MRPLLIVLLVTGVVFAESPASIFITQADAAYAKRSDIPQAKIALFYYQKAMGADPAREETYWKASRAAWWVADHVTTHAEKLAMFQEGMDFAKVGLQKDPNSVEAHFWMGGNMGSYGETKGVLKSLFLVKPIRQEMSEVNRINDRYDGGGGFRVLGVMDYKVPGFAGGSKKRALEELNKSLALDPQHPFTHYYLAEYFKTLGEKDKMRAEWKFLQELKPAADLQPEWEMLIAKGKKNFD